MKKIIIAMLSIIVFVVTMLCMVQPAYTDIDLVVYANADTLDSEFQTTQSSTNITSSQPTDTTVVTPETQPTQPPHVHKFIESVTNPTCTSNGYIDYLCECGEKQERKEITATGHQYQSDVKEPTCTKDGYTTYTCSVCSATHTDDVRKATGHNYGDWQHTKQATPDVNGSKYRSCQNCGKEQTETTVFEFKGNNAVYIPSANIHAKFTVADFNQAAVNSNDVVYSWVDYVNDPFILGHNTGTMKKLYNTEVGDIIYVNKNGELIRYKVVVSEYGVQNSSKNNIIGQTTGASIWDTYDVETLHLYTCYGAIANDRWMVLATRIS